MDDNRVWSFEESLWRATDERYHDRVDEACVMALSRKPYVFAGAAAIEAVSHTPEWDSVEFSDQHVSRPEEGLIVVAYRVQTRKGDTDFHAACTSTYRRRAHDDWAVVQHAQVALDDSQG